jgi:hypothetical protein
MFESSIQALAKAALSSRKYGAIAPIFLFAISAESTAIAALRWS